MYFNRVISISRLDGQADYLYSESLIFGAAEVDMPQLMLTNRRGASYA
jgi:hypothetical protein